MPAIGDKQLKAVTWEDIQALKDGASRKDGRKIAKPISARHRREIVLLVKDIFNLALRLKKTTGVEENPCDLVTLPAISRKKERDEPEEDFAVRLMTAAIETGEPFKVLVIFFSMFLALRRGEICGLPRTAIDRKNLRIQIYTQLQPYGGSVDTKGKPRTIPITAEMLAFIDKHTEANAFLVVSKSGKPLSPNEVSKWVPKLCQDARLTRLTLHDLRAFAVSNLLAMGVDVLTIMEILGHTKIDTSWLYLYAREKNKREALSNLFNAANIG